MIGIYMQKTIVKYLPMVTGSDLSLGLVLKTSETKNVLQLETLKPCEHQTSLALMIVDGNAGILALRLAWKTSNTCAVVFVPHYERVF
jgi:hypothetical protein